jgi:hypothetical protein
MKNTWTLLTITALVAVMASQASVVYGQTNSSQKLVNDKEVPWCGVFSNLAHQVSITTNGGACWTAATPDEIADFSPFIGEMTAPTTAAFEGSIVHETWEWPNPTSSTVNLSFSLAGAETFRISLFNSIGQLVGGTDYREFAAGPNTFSLTGLNLHAGVYHYIINSSSPTSGEFVVNR